MLQKIDKERLDKVLQVIELQKIRFPVAEISKRTGEDKGNVSAYLNGKKPLSNNFYISFLKHFDKDQNELKEVETPYITKRRDLKNTDFKKVPVYGGFTTLGNIQIIDDENVKHQIIAQLPAEVFPGCDYAEKATGDSMYPLIMNQALLVGKMCQVKGIAFGEKYIIKTKDGLDTTKFIHPGTHENKLKLKAYNKSIPEQEIDIEDIIFTCRVKWIINPT